MMVLCDFLVFHAQNEKRIKVLWSNKNEISDLKPNKIERSCPGSGKCQ